MLGQFGLCLSIFLSCRILRVVSHFKQNMCLDYVGMLNSCKCFRLSCYETLHKSTFIDYLSLMSLMFGPINSPLVCFFSRHIMQMQIFTQL